MGRSLAANRSVRSARVQRASADDIQDGEIWVGEGSVFDSPFFAPEMADAMKIKRFRDWIVAGPRSKNWLDGDASQWMTLVLSLSMLTGKTLASNHPVDLPCVADVLVEMTPMPGQRPIISWAFEPA